MEQKNYEAVIGFLNEHHEAFYETIRFLANSKQESEKIAYDMADELAQEYCPRSFFVDQLREVD